MKKTISILLLLSLTLALLSACGSRPAPTDSGAPAAPLRIVTTIFPIYDWTRRVLGERADDAELTMLLDSGVDLHSYQPTAADILKISDCDLFIYVGGEADEWVEDALAEAVNPDMKVINLLDALGDAVKEEELVEGMEDEEDEDEDEEESPEYDEHVWLSLRNARALCDVIAAALAGIDADNAAVYLANAAAYDAELEALDAEYAEVVADADTRTVLFGDRFPFRYLTDDYGLDYYAAFSGCSAESEASFETIVFLANKVDELGLDTILKLESSDGRIAETIRETSSRGVGQILTMDSLQSVTAQDVAAGVTYLSAMRENLEVLKSALS